MMKDLWQMLRGKPHPTEDMYNRRAGMADDQKTALHYADLVILHHRLTHLSRLILILTIAMLTSALGSALSGAAYLIAYFAK